MARGGGASRRNNAPDRRRLHASLVLAVVALALAEATNVVAARMQTVLSPVVALAVPPTLLWVVRGGLQ